MRLRGELDIPGQQLEGPSVELQSHWQKPAMTRLRE